MPTNETHDPGLRSWVAAANDPDGDFPVQNLPFGVFGPSGGGGPWRGGVAIGDQIVDLARVAERGIFSGLAAEAAAAGTGTELNALMAMGPEAWRALRLALSRALREGGEPPGLRAALVPQADAALTVPARIGDYTDFYTSIHHATSIGRQFRPDNPLLPNYKWVPIGYHGRSSSIQPSGQTFHRPVGQTRAPDADAPTAGPCRRLDYELELGLFVGAGNRPGRAIAMSDAESHLFGTCLLNDWSARDIQAWEYQPLGPFLAKSFATTVSPWVVTLEALAPFRVEWTRPPGDPEPLPYLDSAENRRRGAIDIRLEVRLHTQSMRRAGLEPASLSRSSFRYSYWTAAQLLAHHTVNGCNLRPGDLLGTGTQSGPEPEQAGSIIELTGGGKTPLALPGGEQRSFIEDGDTVILRGWCERPGAARIGFGEAAAEVLPALERTDG